MTRPKRSGRATASASKAPKATRTDPTIVVVTKQISEKAMSLTDARRKYANNLSPEARFDAAKPDNRFMRRRDGLGGSGDAHIPDHELWRVREISRHMVLNDDLLGQAFTRLTDNIVQAHGCRYVPQTGDESLDEDLVAAWNEYAEDPLACDYYGERDLAAQAWLAFFQTMQCGDIFSLCVDDGTNQLIEADRCRTSNGGVVNHWLGLDFDGQGRVTHYNFQSEPNTQFGIAVTGKNRQIAARDDEGLRQVCHLYDPRRITQHRGYPWITPLMIKSGMLDDLQFSTVVKAQSAAAHAVFFEREAGTTGGPVRIGSRDTVTSPTAGGSTDQVTHETVRYGLATTLPAGVKAKLATGPIPNQEHFQHVQMIVRQIGASLNMPLEMMLLDASQTNYSGWRGAMDQARMSFVRLQRQIVVSKFYRPINRQWLRRNVSRFGTVARAKHYDGTLYKSRWAPPSWPYINPKEDAEAANVMVTTGQDSPRGIVAKRGGSYDDVIRETVADRSKALRLAITESQKIKAELKYEVSPLLILGWELPGNTALVASQDEQANQNKQGQEGNKVPPVPTAPAPEPEDDQPEDDDDEEGLTGAGLAREIGASIAGALAAAKPPIFNVTMPSAGKRTIVRDEHGRVIGTEPEGT